MSAGIGVTATLVSVQDGGVILVEVTALVEAGVMECVVEYSCT